MQQRDSTSPRRWRLPVRAGLAGAFLAGGLLALGGAGAPAASAQLDDVPRARLACGITGDQTSAAMTMFTATLTTSDGQPLIGRDISFVSDIANDGQRDFTDPIDAVTDLNGTAMYSMGPVTGGLNPTQWTVTARFFGDEANGSATCSLLVQIGSGGGVTNLTAAAPTAAPVTANPLQSLVGQRAALCGPRTDGQVEMQVDQVERLTDFFRTDPQGQWIVVIGHLTDPSNASGQLVLSAQLLDDKGQVWPVASFLSVDYDALAAIYQALDPRFPIEEQGSGRVVLVFDVPTTVRGLLLQPNSFGCSINSNTDGRFGN